MNKLKMILAGSVVAMSMFGVSAGVNAQSAVNECTIDPLPMSLWAKSFTKSGSTISGKFTLKGDANCKKTMTIAVWKAPSANGQPILEQKLFSHKTATFGKGTHSISTNLPDGCFYQVDLLKSANPTAPDGTANYAFQNGVVLTNHPLHDAAYGGSKKCVDKPQEPQKPQKPQEPTKEIPQTPVVEKLPSTGAGSILAGTMGLSTSAGLAYNLIQSRKKLK